MFCSKCGTKNESGAKFCEKCGSKLEDIIKPNYPKKENKKINNMKVKAKELPKKAKIGIIAAIVVVIAAIIALAILLNNPVKKVENYLASYYNNYTEDYGNEELVKIGDILKANKDKKDTLENISNQISKTINNWVKNFNKSYQDEEELDAEYEKVSGILDEIENYFNGLEYVLTYEDYYNYYKEIHDLYNSKSNYFKAVDASDDYD